MFSVSDKGRCAGTTLDQNVTRVLGQWLRHVGAERRRLGWLTVSMFGLFILTGSAAYNSAERLRYAALPLAAALFCIGRLFWIQGNRVWARQHFSLFAWRSRMFEYSGRKVLPFVWAFRAWGAIIALLGAWIVSLWLRGMLG